MRAAADFLADLQTRLELLWIVVDTGAEGNP